MNQPLNDVFQKLIDAIQSRPSAAYDAVSAHLCHLLIERLQKEADADPRDGSATEASLQDKTPQRILFEKRLEQLTGSRPVTWAEAAAPKKLPEAERFRYMSRHDRTAWECWQHGFSSGAAQAIAATGLTRDAAFQSLRDALDKEEVDESLRSDIAWRFSQSIAKSAPAELSKSIEQLVDASQKHMNAYKENDRSDIRTDVLNAFYAGAHWALRPEPETLAASMKKEVLGEVSTSVPSAQHYEQAMFAIVFDDAGVRPEIIVGESLARARFSSLSDNWNAHLFGKLESSCNLNVHGQDNVVLSSSGNHSVCSPGKASQDGEAAS